MFNSNEKIIILGSLLHDIGKFEQRSSKDSGSQYHDYLGGNLINSERFQSKLKQIVGDENYSQLLDMVEKHHSDDAQGLLEIVQIADRLSTGENVQDEKKEELNIERNGKYLSSLFAKINLKSDQDVIPKFYQHKKLSEKNIDIFIPKEKIDREWQTSSYSNENINYKSFKDELEFILNLYEDEKDFSSIVNMILILFEKWMWCIPDFTGSEETSTSLYNHLKDVAALSHAIYLTKEENPDSTNLNLIIGDLPRIQKYIFDVANKKPAKVLRGRSIYVQILTRNFATLFLEGCGLTECSLIMLAGGKFYIVSPDTKKFKNDFENVKRKIESYLIENFRMELSLNVVFNRFDYAELVNKKKTFGQVIEETSFKLVENRYSLFNNHLFENGSIRNNNYIWDEAYIKEDETGTDSIKCKVTDKPIRIVNGVTRKEEIQEGENKINVDLQVKNEYEIGGQVTGDNLLVIIENNGLDIKPKKIIRIDKSGAMDLNTGPKIILNPDLDKLFTIESLKKLGRNFYINAYHFEVANYCSPSKEGDTVMPFDEMVEEQEGAKYLALIKADIDDLGLIMAYGLDDNNHDSCAISLTTTLSYHLKYYFSYFINDFLHKWEKFGYSKAMEQEKKDSPTIASSVLGKVINENRVYTIFAGGDDLMLITPQQSAVKLAYEFNKKFNEFICNNPEIHISYSITHFKDHSPIRIIAELAEENQKSGKKHNALEQFIKLAANDNKSFFPENDKSSTRLFGSLIKNSNLTEFVNYVDKLKGWINSNDISHGLLQKLLDLADMQQKYEDTGDTSYLIAYARTTYAINRIRRIKPDVASFLKHVVQTDPLSNSEAGKIKAILKPLICQVLYTNRN